MAKYKRNHIFLLVINLISFLLISGDIFAQMYIGITGDFGNQVSMYPNLSANLLKSPITPSGSLTLINKEEIRNEWYLQYSGGIGTLGFGIKVLDQLDTISVSNGEHSYSADRNYNTIYVNTSLLFGKQFAFNKRYVAIFVGGGITYYWDSELRSRYFICNATTCDLVFEYEMSRKDNKVKGFMEISVQRNLNSWMLIGLHYRHHFSPALKGTYNFYHMNDSPNGAFSLTQRALSILFLINIVKKT